jgi:Asp-tRNA(Asn)/Glu-tRNA(Gln) amidotransferase A subunit family amidase
LISLSVPLNILAPTSFDKKLYAVTEDSTYSAARGCFGGRSLPLEMMHPDSTNDNAEKERTVIYHRVREFFERYDLLLTPTVAVPPFLVEMPFPQEINGQALPTYIDWFLLTYAITLTGLPAISIPCGWTGEGFPVGLRIVGRRLSEITVLKAAAAFEALAPWHDKRPPIAKE